MVSRWSIACFILWHANEVTHPQRSTPNHLPLNTHLPSPIHTSACRSAPQNAEDAARPPRELPRLQPSQRQPVDQEGQAAVGVASATGLPQRCCSLGGGVAMDEHEDVPTVAAPGPCAALTGAQAHPPSPPPLPPMVQAHQKSAQPPPNSQACHGLPLAPAAPLHNALVLAGAQGPPTGATLPASPLTYASAFCTVQQQQQRRQRQQLCHGHVTPSCQCACDAAPASSGFSICSPPLMACLPSDSATSPSRLLRASTGECKTAARASGRALRV